MKYDHDLLIELRTKMQGLLDAITEVRTGTSAQIKEHEVRLNKQDDRITAGEKKNGVNSTIIAIYSIAVIAMIGLMITHMLK